MRESVDCTAPVSYRGGDRHDCLSSASPGVAGQVKDVSSELIRTQSAGVVQKRSVLEAACIPVSWQCSDFCIQEVCPVVAVVFKVIVAFFFSIKNNGVPRTHKRPC